MGVPGFSLLQDSGAFLSFLIIVRVRVAERAYHVKTIKDKVVAERECHDKTVKVEAVAERV